jgi:putative oxidoreductase
MALLAAVCELVAAVLLAIGLVTPLGAATAAGTMLVAGVAMTAKAGSSWNSGGGGEYPFVLAVVAGALAFTGPGAWSADAAIAVPWAGVNDVPTAATGVITVVVVLLTAVAPIRRTMRTRRSVVGGSGH